MSRFEDRLWSELVCDHGAELARTASTLGSAPSGAAGRRRAGRRAPLSRHARRALTGVVVIGALVAAGAAIFGPTGNPKDITQFECGTGRHGNIRGLFTVEPVAACAALWPAIYHRPAPPLAAWVYETGGAVAVRPAASPPAGSGWMRLPKGWTADGVVIELNDQLEDITTGLPSRPCWSQAAASARVKSILRADGLGYWRMRISAQEPASSRHANCLMVVQVLGGAEIAPDTVLLVERAIAAPAIGAARYPNRFARQRRAVEARVNRTLRSGGCASLTQAATLWRVDARAGGIPTREDVLNAPAPTAAGGAGAACARVFVSEPGGGGPANVLVADYP